MHVMQSIFILSIIICAVNSAPAKNDDVELVEVVPLEKRNATHGFDEYDDDEIPTSFIPVAYFPFNIDFKSLFTGFDEWIERMRNRFQGLIGGEGLDGDKGNTTSTVKVVDNHKVTINDTVYKKDTPFGTQFVKVRTVHVKPLNEDDDGENATTTTKPDKTEIKPKVDVRDTELLDSANDDSNQVFDERQTDVKKSGKLKGSATI